MSGESKGVTRLNKVMIAECCYRLVLKGDKKSQNQKKDVMKDSQDERKVNRKKLIMERLSSF